METSTLLLIGSIAALLVGTAIHQRRLGKVSMFDYLSERAVERYGQYTVKTAMVAKHGWSSLAPHRITITGREFNGRVAFCARANGEPLTYHKRPSGALRTANRKLRRRAGTDAGGGSPSNPAALAHAGA